MPRRTSPSDLIFSSLFRVRPLAKNECWDNAQPRPVKWSCWYPASSSTPTIEHRFGGNGDQPLFTGGLVAPGAAISNVQSEWPLVLLSHGTGGTATGMSWLATRLVKSGCICLGVDHHGNTATEPYRAEGFICWWERPSDLSFMIDRIDLITPINGRVDVTNVAVTGFSLGGYTAFALSGAITSMKQFENWLNRNPNPLGGPREFPNIDKEISRLMSSSIRFRQSWDQHGASYFDPRVSKCVAIAPAPPVRSFLPKSVSDIACPTFIISGEADIEAPFHQCAQWLSNQNSSFQIKSLGENVGHYVFLAECTEEGICVEPDICIDHPTIVRSEIHEYVASQIRDFLAA